MSEQLFREAALARQSERLWGDLILSQPLPVRLLTGFLAVTTLAFMGFLALGDYQRKVSVSGRLVPDRGIVEVSAPVAGTLAAIHVSQHQWVETGTPLFTLEIDHTLHSGQAVSARMLDSIEQQQRSLQHQQELEQQNQVVLQQRFQQNLAFSEQKLAGLLTMVTQQQELLDVRERQEARALQLQQHGMLAAADFETLHTQVLQQRQALEQTQLQQQQTQAEIAELRNDQESRSLQGRQRAEQLQGELAQLQQQQVRLTAEQSTEVVAPVAGRVSHLQAQPGMTTNGQQPVLTLLPQDSQLQAELLVPSSAIGFVVEGQPVSLRFDAFPYQKFGVQSGTVRSIASSSDWLGSGNAAQPLYKVVATIDKQSITAYGLEEPLRSGMLLSADIVVDERSLLEWLLDPLYSIRGRQSH